MKRERCDHCGKRDGDKGADGRMLLVLHLGCCPKARLCVPCLSKRPEVHRHDDESLAEWVKRSNPFSREESINLDPLEQLEVGRSMWVHPEWRRCP